MLGDAADCGRRESEIVDRRLGQLRGRQHGSVELGRKRSGRCDGNRLEPLAAVLECADECDLGS